jgi:hypothetical protein
MLKTFSESISFNKIADRKNKSRFYKLEEIRFKSIAKNTLPLPSKKIIFITGNPWNSLNEK